MHAQQVQSQTDPIGAAFVEDSKRAAGGQLLAPAGRRGTTAASQLASRPVNLMRAIQPDASGSEEARSLQGPIDQSQH